MALLYFLLIAWALTAVGRVIGKALRIPESASILEKNLIGYAIGWGTLTLINAGLAQSKGRSGLAWFLLSLLLGPIATLLIVVLPRVSRAG